MGYLYFLLGMLISFTILVTTFPPAIIGSKDKITLCEKELPRDLKCELIAVPETRKKK